MPTDLELDEEGTRISLTIVDTPGFGDQIDNESRYVLFEGLSVTWAPLMTLTVSPKSLSTLRGNTITSWPKSQGSSEILGSRITEYTHCSISSHLRGMGK
jgi:hypothetical protein